VDTCSKLIEPEGVERRVHAPRGPNGWSSRRSVTFVAKELGLRDWVLRRWVDKLRQEPASAAWRPTSRATPMSADQAYEIARREQMAAMERDILRKWIVIFAEIRT
jgi:transposase